MRREDMRTWQQRDQHEQKLQVDKSFTCSRIWSSINSREAQGESKEVGSRLLIALLTRGIFVLKMIEGF